MGRCSSLRVALRSALASALLMTAPASAKDPLQSVDPAGVTFALPQALEWLDADTFAVGRWDGTISLFRRPRDGEFGPVVVGVAAAPSGRGIEMLARIDDATLASSDGPGRLSVWRRAPDGTFSLLARPSYEPAYGPADSGASVQVGAETLFVSGHEDGHVLVWRWSTGALTLLKAIDVRSAAAPANPWGIHNVRGVRVWRGTKVITGSEDGDVVGLSLPDGGEVFRVRFNPDAKRGINSVSVLGDELLVSNCAVGVADRNAWLFDLSPGRPALLDSENLEVDPQRAQVFDFSAILVPGSGGKVDFFATTEEGLLWQGHVVGGRLVMGGITKVAAEGAAAMGAATDGSIVATASTSLRLFRPD